MMEIFFWETLMTQWINHPTKMIRREWKKCFSKEWTRLSIPNSVVMDLNKMKDLRRGPLEIHSTFRRDLHRLSIFQFVIRVWRQILPYAPTSLSKPPNGWSSILTCKLMKICRDLSLKKWWRTRKTRSQFRSNNNMLRIHFTLLQWKER